MDFRESRSVLDQRCECENPKRLWYRYRDGKIRCEQCDGLAPNPGSKAATDAGCTCPVMDNWRGSDELGRIRGFIVYEGCPLHDTKEKAA